MYQKGVHYLFVVCFVFISWTVFQINADGGREGLSVLDITMDIPISTIQDTTDKIHFRIFLSAFKCPYP